MATAATNAAAEAAPEPGEAGWLHAALSRASQESRPVVDNFIIYFIFELLKCEIGGGLKLDLIEERLAGLAKARADLPLRDVALLRSLNHVSGDFLARMRAALKPYGLTDWSFRTLMMLPRAGDAEARPVSMADLALLTGESGPNLTRICDELVKQDLAVRRPSLEDRRKVCLARTPKADAALEETAPDVWGRLEWVMQVLTDEEKAVMARLLKRLGERLEAEAGQGSRRSPPTAAA